MLPGIARLVGASMVQAGGGGGGVQGRLVVGDGGGCSRVLVTTRLFALFVRINRIGML